MMLRKISFMNLGERPLGSLSSHQSVNPGSQVG